jgi:hypothetical protein
MPPIVAGETTHDENRQVDRFFDLGTEFETILGSFLDFFEAIRSIHAVMCQMQA